MGKNEIKRIRDILGLTIDELAELLSVSHSTVVHWESGIRSPVYKNAKKIVLLAKEHGIKTSVDLIKGY